VIFTATHGLGGWLPGDPAQLLAQGALVCQDWPGRGPIQPSQYFSAADLVDSSEVQVHGLIAFFFGCYSIATPQYDSYFHRQDTQPLALAKEPFFAKLPQRLVTHSNLGALACVGHVDRAWGCSIVSGGAGPQLQPFQNTLAGLMNGVPLGHAVQDFNQKFAVLSTQLLSLEESIRRGAQVPDRDLASRWLERNDAGGFAIFGDPAVHLRVSDLV